MWRFVKSTMTREARVDLRTPVEAACVICRGSLALGDPRRTERLSGWSGPRGLSMQGNRRVVEATEEEEGVSG
jgi:hypothetical protein